MRKLNSHAFKVSKIALEGMNGMIQVLWNCDMGDNCINKDRPGVHAEHCEMERCRGLFTETLEPDATPVRLKPVSDYQ